MSGSPSSYRELEPGSWFVSRAISSPLLIWLHIFGWIIAGIIANPATAAQVNENHLAITVAPGFNHVPITIPVHLAVGEVPGDLQVQADAAWAIPSIDPDSGNILVEFETKNLISSTVATLTLSSSESSVEIFLNVKVAPLDVYRLVADPYRSIVYGIHRSGIDNGAVFAYDPSTGVQGYCVTVGEHPTDFVLTEDGMELLVINSVGKSISVIDLNFFEVAETLTLPDYGTWGSAGQTTANIGLGPDDIIYFVDGRWGPILHVYQRNTGQVIQSITYTGQSPSNTTGFMDFAVNSDKTKLYAMPQYGWSAGAHTPSIAHYSIAEDGRVTFLGTNANAGLLRQPFEAPVLITADDQTVFMKTIAVSANDIDFIKKGFPSDIWAISPNGEWASTGSAIFDFQTGNELISIPDGTNSVQGYIGRHAQVFTPDYAYFVYFSQSDRTLRTLNLFEINTDGLGSSITPANNSVTLAPKTLSWQPILGVEGYHLYIGTSQDAVDLATIDSPEFLGTVAGSSYTFANVLDTGVEYFWRVDPVAGFGPQRGSVLSFTTSAVVPTPSVINERLTMGEGVRTIPLVIDTKKPDETWTIHNSETWISTSVSAGAGTDSLTVMLDSTDLEPGIYIASLDLESSTGVVPIQVKFTVDPLNITILRSDPDSSLVYAVSETPELLGSVAALLEIDTANQTILRSVAVGNSVTDIVLHAADERIYVTNWRKGQLLAVGLESFEVEETYPFSAWGQGGNPRNDVNLVSAGGPERLVIEERDQWINMYLYDTTTGTKLASQSTREGGGAHDSTGRYYYHGENNISNAGITRYDLTGDQFAVLGTKVRPNGVAHFGSRTVVVSEDDSRVFWANVAFDAQLNPVWVIGEPVYAASADGRYAFSETKIYDINRQLHILGMPAQTQVSTFNSTTSTLVAGVGDSLHFHHFSAPFVLQSPVLLDPDINGDQATIKWQDRSLETGFHLQKRVAGVGQWEDVNASIPQNTTSAVLSGLDQMMAYEFRLRAFATETSSTWSEVITVDLGAIPPNAPHLLHEWSSGSTQITIDFFTNGFKTHSEVERTKETEPDGWEVVEESTSTRFIDTDLEPDTTYLYRVRNFKGDLPSAYTPILAVTTAELQPPPRPATPEVALDGESSVSINWSNVQSATSYRVERALQVSPEVWSTMGTVDAPATSLIDETVLPGTTYRYRIFAVNDAGESDSSFVATISIPSLPSPTAPANFFGQAGSDNTIALSWTDSQYTTHYLVQRRIGEATWDTIAELDAGSNQFTDSELEEGIYYNYRIVAVNTVDEIPSGEISVLAGMTGVLFFDNFDPFNFSLWDSFSGGFPRTGEKGFLDGNAFWFGWGGQRSASTRPLDLSSGGTISFQFRAGNQDVDGSLWDNSEPGEEVVLEYSTVPGIWEPFITLDTVYPSHSSWTAYSLVIPMSARSSSTSFRWRQLSNSGPDLDTWALDNVIIEGTLLPPPVAPSFVLANSTNARAASLFWAESTNALGYTIERRTPTTDWVEVGTTGAQSFYLDESVTPATAYSYRIRAFNTGGSSEPSIHAFVTTWSVLQEWRFQNYGITANAGAASGLEDNGTGIANLIRFAFNMAKDDSYQKVNPNAPERGLPTMQIEDETLHIAFLRRRGDDSGLVYIVEFTNDLVGWVPGGTEILAEPISEDFEYVLVRDPDPPKIRGARFARVRISEN